MFEHYNDIVTISELSELLNIGKNACYKLLASGDIKVYPFGKRWKIPKQEGNDYIRGKMK